MSTLLEILKVLAAPVAGLTGAAIGYGGGMHKDRESRYHQRVELLYQEMLGNLAADHGDLMRNLEITKLFFSEPPGYDPSSRREIHVRAELFASTEVFQAWNSARRPLDGLRMAFQLKAKTILVSEIEDAEECYTRARGELVKAMRVDLQVTGPLRRAVRWVRLAPTGLRRRGRLPQVG